MLTSDFDYDMPPELIAQEPPAERTAARMLVLTRATGAWEHSAVVDLPVFLRDGDLLVLNNTRVFPARLLGAWADTGGAVEFLLLEPTALSDESDRSDRSDSRETWLCLCGSGRRARGSACDVRRRLCGSGASRSAGRGTGDRTIPVRTSAGRRAGGAWSCTGAAVYPPCGGRCARDARP